MKHSLTFMIVFLTVTMTGEAQGWRKQFLPEIDSTARIIQFVDSLNGWVLAERQLFVTTDGGDTWDRSAYPSNHTLLRGRLISDQIGFVVLSNKDPKYNYIQPIIYSFTFQGRVWKKLFQMQHPIAYSFSTIVEKSYCFIVGESSTEVKRYSWRINIQSFTADSARLPLSHPFPIGNWAYSNIGFLDSLMGYITAHQLLAPDLLPWGIILKTTDGGKSWTDDTVMYAAGFYEVEFTDNLKGYISAEVNFDYDPTFGRWSWSTALRYTINGGMTWMYVDHVPVRKGWFLDDTTFLSLSKEFFAWSKDGVLYRSILKGRDVNTAIVFDKEPISDFCALNERYIWLLAKDGNTIYKWDALLGTATLNTLLPTTLRLSHNYPNPAQSTTYVDVALPRRMHLRINLYDLLGRSVRTLIDAEYEEGVHTISFDMTNIAAGLYCCQMIVNDMQESLTAVSKWMSVQ